MRVLHAVPELFPLLKVGGLADVAAALPAAQAAQGLDVRLLLPGLPPVLDGLADLEALPAAPGEGRLLRGRAPSGLEAYVLDAPERFAAQAGPYGHPPGDPGTYRAFAAAAAVLATSGDGRGWRPDVLHLHDWPTALAASYVAREAGPRAATVLTIHNGAYQGLFPAESFPALGLPAEAFRPEGLEFHGLVSLLKAGLQDADRLATVSPTYARELRAPGGGWGLEGLYARRAGHLSGILNGVDPAAWDPARDPALAAPVAPGDPAGRAANRAAVLDAFGLGREDGGPLFAVVSRLDPLKGLDLLLACAPPLLARGARLAVLGQGDPVLEAAFARLAEEHPGRAGWVGRTDEGLARRIFAGADFLVVPSRAEPCGLTQLYAMRYGAVPVVRRTGGLADTVEEGPEGTGFVFDAPTPEALQAALDRAFHHFLDPPALAATRARCMGRDHGWEAPAAAYRRLYEEIGGA
ncbi:MAG: glycogen synthase GlgA [Holophagaceae bacterium]